MAEVAIPRNLFAEILPADHGTVAADGHVNRVTSSICHAFHQKPRETCVLVTENSPLFGSRPRADILRSACGTHSDDSVLQIAASAANLSFTKTPIWGNLG